MEQALLRQWGKIGKVPARAGTTAVVKKTAGGGIPMVAWGCWEGERGRGGGGGGGRGSCWSEHCCGSEEIYR